MGTENEFDSSDHLTVPPSTNLDHAPDGSEAHPRLPFWERPKAKKDLRWFSDLSAIPHTAMWSLAELLVLCGAWQVAKKFRNRLIGVAVGFAPFFVVLYFVFENINRLLPPNL